MAQFGAGQPGPGTANSRETSPFLSSAVQDGGGGGGGCAVALGSSPTLSVGLGGPQASEAGVVTGVTNQSEAPLLGIVDQTPSGDRNSSASSLAPIAGK